MTQNNLKKILAEKKISVKLLAEKIAISPTHLSYVMHGKRNISFELAEKIADFLEITLSQLFENDTETAPLLNLEVESVRPKQPKDLIQFLDTSEVMFDGVPLTDDDKLKIKKALELVFWDAKQQNKHKKT